MIGVFFYPKSGRRTTHEDVMQMLAETEIPFAYDHFAEGESPDPPFITVLFYARKLQ